MRLEDFPAFVIREIASYLPLRDVVILAQQSHQIHHACETELREGHRQVQLSSFEDCCHGFQILLWTLRWPSLGQYVLHIEMNTSYGGECLDIPRPRNKRSLSDKDTALLKAAIRRLGFEKNEYDEIWLQISTIPEDASTAYKPMDFTTDKEKARVTAWAQALATMFISISPNLESLAFAPVSWRRNVTYEPRYTLKQFLAHVSQHPESSCAQALKNLRYIKLLPWGRHTPGIYASYPLSVSMKLAGHLPTVEACCVDGVQSLDAEVLKPASCHFKTIRIHQSCLSSRALVHVISSSKELQEFDYCFGSFRTEDIRAVVCLQDLLDALCKHTETLRILNLYLVSQHTNMNRHNNEAYNEATAELADFGALTHLSLGMDLLLCFTRGFTDDSDDNFSLIERLPPQLECLTIYGYRPGRNALWDKLLEELKEIIVDGDECVFTLRGIDEYLRHPANPDPKPEPGEEGIARESEDEGIEYDSDASDRSWDLAPGWYKGMHPRRRRNDD